MPRRAPLSPALLSSISDLRFYGVSHPFETESANSFLQRLSAQYSLSFPKLKRALGIDWGTDPDCTLTPETFGRIAQVCGLAPASFALMRTAFTAIAESPELADLIRFLPGGRPHYRFCVDCWSADHVPHLRLEWRLQHWTVCPVHRRGLNDRCARCQQEWSHETALLARSGGSAYALSNCPKCGHDQRRTAVNNGSHSTGQVEEEIGLGRAVMAALCSGFFMVSGRGGRERLDISYLPDLLKASAENSRLSFQPASVRLVRDHTTRVSLERRLARERCGHFDSGRPARTIADTVEFSLSGLASGATRASRAQNPIDPLGPNFSRTDRDLRPIPPTTLWRRKNALSGLPD